MHTKKFTSKQKLKILLAVNKHDKPLEKVCKKHKCSRQSLWRWSKNYDGSLESLTNKSERPLTPHPNEQTDEEKKLIENLIKDHPTYSNLELWGILRDEHNYTRHYMTMVKYIRKTGLRPKIKPLKYVPQLYDTPSMLGVKWQLDVKYVPRECIVDFDKNETRFFQYTVIDEATRERFLYAYSELSAVNTCDFLKRSFEHFKYLPYCIQTDNGSEFTNSRKRDSLKIHLVDEFLGTYDIRHYLIKPYTPRHNGKIERSHKTDNDRFYKYNTFIDLQDLNTKLHGWMIRYNKTPIKALKDKNGKCTMQSPKQKREELLNKVYKTNNFDKVRLLIDLL
jgi:transposase InsO family protein/transposase-like protein